MANFKDWFRENRNSLLIILGIVMGIICGLILKSFFVISPLVLTYIGLPGELLVRAFKMIIVPLIVTSLSTSITSTKMGENNRLMKISFVIILLFSIFASIFGPLLVILIKPGVRTEENGSKNLSIENSPQINYDINQIIGSQDQAIYDMFINFVPDNIIAATFMMHYTALVPIDAKNLSLGYKKVSEKSFKPNMLGFCGISIALGFVVLHLGQRAHTIKTILNETNLIIMTILDILVKIVPFGMLSMMCVEVIKMKSPEKIILQLGWFIATAFLAFAIIWLIFFPGIYFIALRKNPFKLYYDISSAIIVALSTTSSLITLPMTMKCMEENHKLAQPISHFFLPLGMNMHMPGTAMYYPMVAVFVAQMRGMDITLTILATLCIYTVIQTMAVPALPSGGPNVAYFAGFCAIIGIENPLEILVYTLAIDKLMDGMRTATNVTGDCVIAPIIEKYSHIQKDTDIELSPNEITSL